MACDSAKPQKKSHGEWPLKTKLESQRKGKLLLFPTVGVGVDRLIYFVLDERKGNNDVAEKLVRTTFPMTTTATTEITGKLKIVVLKRYFLEIMDNSSPFYPSFVSGAIMEDEIKQRWKYTSSLQGEEMEVSNYASFARCAFRRITRRISSFINQKMINFRLALWNGTIILISPSRVSLPCHFEGWRRGKRLFSYSNVHAKTERLRFFNCFLLKCLTFFKRLFNLLSLPSF